jgi:acyl homoserine lactone synthase
MRSQILMARQDEPGMTHRTLHRMYRFRHKIFRQRLGWEVESAGSLERDAFDDLKPVYLIAQNEQQQIEGSWRLLPTTGPYMLKDTFPQLLRGEPAPQDEAIWEISRFAVAPCNHHSRSQAVLSSITFAMFKAGVAYAQQHGIRHYVFVTSVAVERLLRRAGLPIHRFGDGTSQRIGKVDSVACWIPINLQTYRAVNIAVTAEEPREVA